MGEDTLQKIIDFLTLKDVPFTHLTHEHVHTSEDAAKIRGNTVMQAAKAIILKVKYKANKSEYKFIQVVISGHKKIDLKKLKKLLSLESASLATPDEVLENTTCTIGSVPPFGKLLGIETFADVGLRENEFIFFSAGTHNDSIKMSSADYIRVLAPEVIDIAKEE
jgi:Ala-tRNA(Pro) deacylase